MGLLQLEEYLLDFIKQSKATDSLKLVHYTPIFTHTFDSDKDLPLFEIEMSFINDDILKRYKIGKKSKLCEFFLEKTKNEFLLFHIPIIVFTYDIKEEYYYEVTDKKTVYEATQILIF